MISVQNLHTFQLQANAKRITKIATKPELANYIGKKNGVDFVLLGGGSNSVFIQDYFGEILVPEFFGKRIETKDSCYKVEANSSENWHLFVHWLLANKVYGLENLALIPGTVGACPIQNIGAYGVEVSQFIERVEYFDLNTGQVNQLSNEECKFGYRDSIFKSTLKANAVITNVTFSIPIKWQPVTGYGELKALDNPTAEHIFEEVIRVRNAKLPDPESLGNAGSFFKNPIVNSVFADSLIAKFPEMPVYNVDDGQVKIAAGWLIDNAGLKGTKVNSIAVHNKQALVLINSDNNGLGQDLIELVVRIQQTIFSKFGINLETEVRCFGQSGEMVIGANKGVS